MSKAAEIKKLLHEASSQGFTHHVAQNGHVEVIAPDGNRVQISATPGSDASVRSARTKLVRIGFRRQVPPKPKQQAKAKRPAREKMREEGGPMPKIGETARVTGGMLPPVAPARGEVMPKEEILEKLSLAAWLVWQSIIEAVRDQDVVRESLHDGVMGYEWAGSRHKVISKLWPSLDRPNWDTGEMPLPRRVLGEYLARSKNMHSLRDGSRTRLTLWWVRGDFNEVDPKQLQRAAKTGNWWEDRLTPDEAGETREPEPVTVSKVSPADHDGASDAVTVPERVLISTYGITGPDGITLYHCPDCAFVTAKQGSLSTHRIRITGAHPEGRIACAVRGCLEVRTDPDSLGNHISKDHRELGLQVCRKCGGVFHGRQARVEHQVREHHGRASSLYGDVSELDVPKRSVFPIKPVVAPEVRSTLIPSAIVTPSQHQQPPDIAATLPGADPITSLQNLLTEVSQLRDTVAGQRGLEVRLDELERENGQLRARDQAIVDWLRTYPFLADDPTNR